jgi:hypothetical protein
MRPTSPNFRRTHQRARVFEIVLVSLALMQGAAFADGGQLQGSELSGPFVISLYTSPIPLRTGTVELTALITNSADRTPVLDATVQILLRSETHPESAFVMKAMRGGDGLRYFATPKLKAAGRWSIRIEASNSQGSGTFIRTLAVEDALPIYISLWPVLAFPPVAIAVFALQQRLRKRLGRVR